MDVGQHYGRSRHRLVALLHGSGTDVWGAAVPACPGWRVHDVVAHLVGNVEDAIAGRLAGAPSEAQTAEQVERHLDDAPEALLATWSELAPPFEAVITEVGALPAAIDALSHELDIRHAIGRPGGHDDVLIPELARTLLERLDGDVHLTAILDGVAYDGVGTGPALGLRTSAFEVFRAGMGRRSLDQVLALGWTGDPAPVLERFFVFGPAAEPLVEPAA